MARVRFRVDGQLREVVQPPVAVRGQLASRIKVMARLDISEKTCATRWSHSDCFP